MYLEISGRQTGKTMRLVAEVNRFLGENPDHVACIIVGTGGMIRDFHRRFPADINDFRGNNPCPRIHIRTSYKELVNSFRNPRGGRVVAEENIRWFWDEFDYHSLREVPVLETGYYCGTAKFNRSIEDWERWSDDVLLRLLVENNFMYTSHHGMKHLLQNGTSPSEFKSHYSPEEFAREMLSGFDAK